MGVLVTERDILGEWKGEARKVTKSQHMTWSYVKAEAQAKPLSNHLNLENNMLPHPSLKYLTSFFATWILP